jgi:hypothetical protein
VSDENVYKPGKFSPWRSFTLVVIIVTGMQEKPVKHEPSSPTIDFKVYELETRSRVDIEPCPFKDVDCVKDKALWRKLDL